MALFVSVYGSQEWNLITARKYDKHSFNVVLLFDDFKYFFHVTATGGLLLCSHLLKFNSKLFFFGFLFLLTLQILILLVLTSGFIIFFSCVSESESDTAASKQIWNVRGSNVFTIHTSLASSRSIPNRCCSDSFILELSHCLVASKDRLDLDCRCRFLRKESKPIK